MPGYASRVCSYLFRGALCYDSSAFFAATGAEVDYIVAISNHVEVMLNDDDGCAKVEQLLEHPDERLCVQRMQPDGRFVKDEDAVVLAASHFTGQFEALRFSSRKVRGGFA